MQKRQVWQKATVTRFYRAGIEEWGYRYSNMKTKKFLQWAMYTLSQVWSTVKTMDYRLLEIQAREQMLSFERMLQTGLMIGQTHHPWLKCKRNRYDKTGAQTIDNFHYQLVYPDAQGDNRPKHNDIQHFLTYKAAKSHMREAESGPCGPNK